MQSFKATETKVTLVLSEEEADWLHVVMQNPSGGTESLRDAEMRKKFFEATDTKVTTL